MLSMGAVGAFQTRRASTANFRYWRLSVLPDIPLEATRLSRRENEVVSPSPETDHTDRLMLNVAFFDEAARSDAQHVHCAGRTGA
jgi:hypothetical protein